MDFPKVLQCTFRNTVSCTLQLPTMLFLGHCEGAHEIKKKKINKKKSLGFGIGRERHSSVIPSSSHAVNPSLPLSDQSQSWSSAPRLQSKTCRNRNIIIEWQNSRCACCLSLPLICLCVKLRGYGEIFRSPEEPIQWNVFVCLISC